MEETKKYAYWLNSVPSVGARTIKKLLECCNNNPAEVYHASEETWGKVMNAKQLAHMKIAKEQWDLQGEYHMLKEKAIGFLTLQDEEYPGRLRHIPDAPYGIFYKGRLPGENDMSVAIIGARECSAYGSYVASGLGEYLAQKGVQIISGMARGIDGISQQAALNAGGISFGVPGCGPDICYPAGNRGLYEQLIEKGGILSIYPPGESPKPQNFPRRNAIVSGLADVVVVVEARERSGTLITVDMALEQGRDVYVVPGRITDRLSDGCNGLLKQGAGIVMSPGDFYEEIYHNWQEKRTYEKNVATEEGENVLSTKLKISVHKRVKVHEGISHAGRDFAPNSDLGKVYGALDFYPRSIEQIRERLPENFSYVQVNTLLMRLCVEGAATQISPGYFSLGKE